MPGIMLIDGNSLGFAAQSTSKLTAGEMEVQAIFHFLKSLRITLLGYSGFKPIVLWDGRSWRYDHFAGYKAKRKEDPKAIAEKERYKAQKPWIARATRTLGVNQMMAINWEADDLAGLLTSKARSRGDSVVLISGDKDWLQLVEPGVLWFDPIREVKITYRDFQTQTGYVNGRAFLQGKALKGDSSDCIPGVGGIGDKAAPILLEKFGSVEKFWAAAETPGFELPEELARYRKKLTEFCAPEGRDRFAFNMMLMDLKTAERPKPERLTLDKGAFDRAAFRSICEDLSFHSLLRDLDNFCAAFNNNQRDKDNEAA
ncbi:5'-3' exonuclease H3TH domain-containing protein [Magnetospirillum molischianum]|uniref:Putative exonuclease n=1 Tax=Magnetospirillum molischianum DSM 120 TaxID=1150626 RepID=H8FY96_MAGML|nr:5'-3' exonuclease H3TH domain-containing protein [Magnetospirillum molischianum]CCG43334.1 putative exonuclease [Magnetospirillum molischianum DSM 120]